MEMKVIFSKKLCALREAKGKEYTRQKVANELNISRASLEYYEKGQRLPDIEIAAKIADYYDVSVDYLLGRSESQSNDKEITEVANYLGLSDAAVMEILKSSGKITEDEWCDWLFQMYKERKPDNATILCNGYNSSQANICNWIINNMLGETHNTISVLLADMYKAEKYDKKNLSFDLSDKAYMFLNRLTDRYKYKIDKLLIDCSESTLYSKYNSIYESDFGNVEDWYCGEFRNIDEVDEYMKNSNDAEIKIEIDAEGATNIIGNSESETFREIVRIVNEHNKSKKTKAGD